MLSPDLWSFHSWIIQNVRSVFWLHKVALISAVGSASDIDLPFSNYLTVNLPLSYLPQLLLFDSANSYLWMTWQQWALLQAFSDPLCIKSVVAIGGFIE